MLRLTLSGQSPSRSNLHLHLPCVSVANYFLLLVMSCSLGSFPHVVYAEELSFAEMYRLASINEPSLEIAKYDVDSAKSKKDQALGKLFPQASVFAQWSENRLSYEAFESPGLNDSSYPGQRYGLTIRQPLLAVSDGLEVNRQALLYEVSKDELQSAAAGLLSGLLTAYLGALMAAEEVELLEAEISAVETQLEESEALYAKNLVSVTQVLDTQSRRDALRADLIMAKGNEAVAREGLIAFTGIKGTAPLPVQENFGLLNRFENPEEAAETANFANPLIAAAEKSVSAAQKAVMREKSRWIPSLAVSYSFQHSDVGFDNQRSNARDVSTIAVDFQYPLFEGGAKFARIRGASADYNIAKTRLRAQILDIETKARSAWLVFEAASERVVSARQTVTSSEVSVMATRGSVKAGTAKFTDVLLALANYSRARRDLVDARFFYAQAWVELELLAGGMPDGLAMKLSSQFHPGHPK